MSAPAASSKVSAQGTAERSRRPGNGGWIRTDLGGAQAPFTIEKAIPSLVDVLLAARATPGLQYLDRFGATVPW